MPPIALIAAMLLRLRVGRITPHGTPDWTRTGVLRPSSACTKDGRRTKNARIPYGSRRNSDRCQKSPGRSTISRPSQTLTSPQRVRYSTPMATRWSDEQRTHALDQLANGHTLAETHTETGIPKSNLRRWAAEANITVVRTTEKTREATLASKANAEQRRAALVEKLGRIAELAGDLELEILMGDERPSLRDVVGARTRAIHDAELLAGRATSRTESVTALDAELEELTAALSGNDVAQVEADA